MAAVLIGGTQGPAGTGPSGGESQEIASQNEAYDQPVEFVDAVSREFTYQNDSYGQDVEFVDAVSREFTYQNDSYDQPVEFVDAVSREFTYQNDSYGQDVEFVDAVSREFTYFNNTVAIASLPDVHIPENVAWTSDAPSLLYGDPPVAWSLVAGPVEMTMPDTTTGVVTWPDPMMTGSPFTVMIRATNAESSGQASFKVYVEQVPVIAAIADATIRGGEPVYAGPVPQLLAGTIPVTWSLLAGPAGMTIDAATGVVSWLTPTDVGSPFAITIRATNAVGHADATWHLSVDPAPLIATIPDATIPELTAYQMTPALLHATPPVTWSLQAGPAGMTIDPVSGTISWLKPIGAEEPCFVLLKVADATGSDSEAFALTVPISYTANVAANVSTTVDGTSVLLQGMATRLGSGEPMADVPVTIRIRVQGTRRVILAQTDAAGVFQALWRPLAGEAGHYQVGADHPGVTADTTQDEFTLYGMQCDPRQVVENIRVGQMPQTHQVTLRNPGDTPLTGLVAVVEGVAENLSVQVNPPIGLAVYGTAPLRYSVMAQDATIPNSSFTIRVTSTEGAVALMTVAVNVAPDVPHLVVDPTSLQAGMLRGEQTLVQFDVINDGGAASEEVLVQVPAAPWLRIASAPALDPLEPGARATVVLALSPAADMPLGPYNGTLVISTELSSVTVPFTFSCISDRKGDLRVTASDEFTYYAEGSPPVAGASVTVSDLPSGQVVATGTTDASGTAAFEGLTEAYYKVEVTAPDHGTFGGQVLVSAGVTKHVAAFLPRQLVKYVWTVLPTEVPDRYDFTVQALFETHVPAPVVTIEPAFVDLDNLGCEVQINFTVTNHGLITAQNVKTLFSDSGSRYELIPLVQEIGDLPAHGTAVVPVRIRDRECAAPAPTSGSGGADASQPSGDMATDRGLCLIPEFGVQHERFCGEMRTYVTLVRFRATMDGCTGPSPGIPPFGWGPFGGGDVRITPFEVDAPGCCEPRACDCLKAWSDCAWSFTPMGCMLNLTRNCYGESDDWVRQAIACYGDGLVLSCLGGGLGLNIAQCVCELDNACNVTGIQKPCSLTDIYDMIVGSGASGGSAAASGEPIPAADGGSVELERLRARVALQYQRLLTILKPLAIIYGSPAWLEAAAQDPGVFEDWNRQYLQAIDAGSEAGTRIGEAERQGLLAAVPVPLTAQDVVVFLDRYDRSLDYYAMGIFSLADVPFGQSTDFIPRDQMLGSYDAAAEAVAALNAEGFGDPFDAVRQAARDYEAYMASHQEAGICARVRIQLDQQAVISRAGFKASLELQNTGDCSLDSVNVVLNIRDADGVDASDRFGVGEPVLTNIVDVSGSGSVPGGTTGRAEWTLLSTDAAAPSEAATYFVGGTLSYVANGTAVTIPLFPAEITVLPNPKLHVKYFLERMVYSDDPFTLDVVEPAVPFSLGLIMSNSGAGVANNVRITSSQPRIIENEKGLLIDFNIVGTRVGSQSLSPSMTANLGDIGPGQAAVAQWLMAASLQGKFLECSAAFEHVNGLGKDELSLVDGVEIFPITHVVRVDSPTDDGLPDFLATAPDDEEALPHAIHTSDGQVLPVSVVVDGTVDGSPDAADTELQLTAPMPAGWSYLRIDDPAAQEQQYRLTSVMRSDGKVLRMGENVWTTHRIVRLVGQAPYSEDYLHIVDFDGTGSYTLLYSDMLAWDVPLVGDATATTLVLQDLGSAYGDATEHAVQETLSGRYVGPQGKLQVNPFWQPLSAWRGTRVWGLTPSTGYSFAAKARVSGIETDWSSASMITTSVAGDIDGEGTVDVVDLLYLVESFGYKRGEAGYETWSDFNADGWIDVIDLLILVENWPE